MVLLLGRFSVGWVEVCFSRVEIGCVVYFVVLFLICSCLVFGLANLTTFGLVILVLRSFVLGDLRSLG